MELLIYTLTWAVEIGLCFVFAISYLRADRSYEVAVKNY